MEASSDPDLAKMFPGFCLALSSSIWVPMGAQLSLPWTHTLTRKHTHTHSLGTQPHSWGPASSTPTKLAQFLLVRGGNAAAAMDMAGPVLHHAPWGSAIRGACFW